MPSFSFRARDGAGRNQQGVVEAAGAGAAVQTLRQRGWLVFDVHAADAAPSVAQQLAYLNPWERLPPRSVDVEMSCKQLAVMLRGGLTLLTALQAVAEQSDRPSLRRAWKQVSLRLQEGSGFAGAMAEARCFPRLLVQLVKVGEQTGRLEQTIDRAAETLESRRTLRSSLLTALTYPALVFLAAMGVSVFLVVEVIPKLRIFLAALGRKLPAITQLLLDVSDVAQRYFYHFAAGGLILTAAAVALYMNPLGRLWMDRLALRLPIVGNLFRLAGTAGFARSLGILVRSGITLLDGLRTAEELTANRYLSVRIAAARQAVIQGGNLADPLRTPHAFTPMLGRMISVGEASGTLDEVLDEVAKFHEAQLKSAIRTLSVVIEPVIILTVGGIVGFVYIAFFVALFSPAGA